MYLSIRWIFYLTYGCLFLLQNFLKIRKCFRTNLKAFKGAGENGSWKSRNRKILDKIQEKMSVKSELMFIHT